MYLKSAAQIVLKDMANGVRSNIMFVLSNLNRFYIDTILHQLGGLVSTHSQSLNTTSHYDWVESRETAEDRLATKVFEELIEPYSYEP